VPATYEMLDDALRRAGQVGRAGGVAWLIEGDDKTRLERGLIEQTLRKRSHELEIVEQPALPNLAARTALIGGKRKDPIRSAAAYVAVDRRPRTPLESTACLPSWVPSRVWPES